ncbi:MAG TPA: MFS transporter [Gammaproteobacteria bacterium]|nr:MFS transporter [Gammaproteobacteria bacterium]
MKLNAPTTPFEIRTVFSLAGIFSFRMLGLFIILPIFALYTQQLQGATPTLMGIALGIYGLTQAIFQIPLAMLSDKIGRKSIITAGLVIFIVGSVIAALSHSIYGVIIGRALQGAGAVGSTILALVADLTSMENRTKAMAVIGMTIGISFAVAMVLGPALNLWVGLSGIFWITALFGIISIMILLLFVPQPPQLVFHRDAETLPKLLKSTLANLELLRLNFGILSLHALLTASFIVIPVMISQLQDTVANHAWIVYLPAMAFAFFAIMPCIIVSEKYRQIKVFFVVMIFVLGITQWLLWYFHTSTWEIITILCIFFTAFTFLEATLPSLISKIAPVGSKGTAIGVYSSSQFFGIFLGGSLGGWVYSHYHFNGIFILNLMFIFLWLLIAVTMRQPPYLTTLMLPLGNINEPQAQLLTQEYRKLAGVIEAVVLLNEKTAYLKVDRKILDLNNLLNFNNKFNDFAQ